MSDELDDVTEGASPIVRYSAKELFARIDRKLDVVLEMVNLKADKVEVDELSTRVDGAESRIQSLEDRGSTRTEAVKAAAWVLGTTIAASGVIAGIIVAIHALSSGGH